MEVRLALIRVGHHAVGEHVGVHAEGRERGAHLVGDGGDKGGAALAQAGHAAQRKAREDQGAQHHGPGGRDPSAQGRAVGGGGGQGAGVDVERQRGDATRGRGITAGGEQMNLGLRQLRAHRGPQVVGDGGDVEFGFLDPNLVCLFHAAQQGQAAVFDPGVHAGIGHRGDDFGGDGVVAKPVGGDLLEALVE